MPDNRTLEPTMKTSTAAGTIARAPKEQRCSCGEPAAVVRGADVWCVACVPVDVQRDLDAERQYDATRDAR